MATFGQPHRRRLVTFVVLSAVTALLTVAAPVLAGWVVDEIVDGGDERRIALLAVVGPRGVAGARRHDAALAGPVVVYMVVISAMVVAAFGSTIAVAVAGALLFYASDATLAWNRFVQPFRWGNLAVMVTYHLGQAGLALSLL